MKSFRVETLSWQIASGTVEVTRRSGKFLTFDASYTYTRDLSNAGGATPNAFAVSAGSY